MHRVCGFFVCQDYALQCRVLDSLHGLHRSLTSRWPCPNSVWKSNYLAIIEIIFYCRSRCVADSPVLLTGWPVKEFASYELAKLVNWAFYYHNRIPNMVLSLTQQSSCFWFRERPRSRLDGISLEYNQNAIHVLFCRLWSVNSIYWTLTVISADIFGCLSLE